MTAPKGLFMQTFTGPGTRSLMSLKTVMSAARL